MLPEQFWKENEHGVKGGIEAGFLSTTLERGVATSYAAGGPGFVFEVRVRVRVRVRIRVRVGMRRDLPSRCGGFGWLSTHRPLSLSPPAPAHVTAHMDTCASLLHLALLLSADQRAGRSTRA